MLARLGVRGRCQWASLQAASARYGRRRCDRDPSSGLLIRNAMSLSASTATCTATGASSPSVLNAPHQRTSDLTLLGRPRSANLPAHLPSYTTQNHQPPQSNGRRALDPPRLNGGGALYLALTGKSAMARRGSYRHYYATLCIVWNVDAARTMALGCGTRCPS